MSFRKIALYIAFAFTAGAASAEPFNAQQIQTIRDTAASICTTIKEARGQKTDVQVQGEIGAQLNGLLGKIVSAGAQTKGTFNQNDFQGITQDATAAALQGDRECRERVFNRMFDKLSLSSPAEVQTVTASYIVCVGEHAQRCPQNSVHLYCGASVADWAKRECQTFSESRLSSVSGNRCGYYTAQVTCVKLTSK